MDIKTLLQNNQAYMVTEDTGMEKFEGTFNEIIMLNNEGLIKPVFDGEQLVGLCYDDPDSNGDKVEEAQIQYDFYKAFMFKPVQKWLGTLYSINDLKKYLCKYSYNESELDTIQDLLNDILEDLSNPNSNTTPTTPIQTPAGILSDSYMFEAEETIRDYYCLSEAELLKAIKKYLSITYGYCLARNNNIKVSIVENDEGHDYIKVENVTWGRKLTQSELAKREEAYYSNI